METEGLVAEEDGAVGAGGAVGEEGDVVDPVDRGEGWLLGGMISDGGVEGGCGKAVVVDAGLVFLAANC